MTFKEKVQSMSAKEIILAMVKGVRAEHVKIEMSSFGHHSERGVCYGCAATNTICEISGSKLTPETIEFERHWKAIETDPKFLSEFEYAIDYLRCGELDEYNVKAKKYGFATIDKLADLPHLTTHNYKKHLACYEQFAISLTDDQKSPSKND